MGSQNYLNMAFEKLGHIMLDDMRMKASDIYKLAVKRQKLPQIKRVNYVGLEGNPFHALAQSR